MVSLFSKMPVASLPLLEVLRADSRNNRLGREIAKNEIPSNSDRMKP